jgi:hypothetical protein
MSRIGRPILQSPTSLQAEQIASLFLSTYQTLNAIHHNAINFAFLYQDIVLDQAIVKFTLSVKRI